MADEIDLANERMDIELERAVEALRARRIDFQESPEECVECGAEIALARRQALPGVQLCIGCAEVAERKRIHRCG